MELLQYISEKCMESNGTAGQDIPFTPSLWREYEVTISGIMCERLQDRILSNAQNNVILLLSLDRYGRCNS